MKKVLVMCIVLALVVAGAASANYVWKFNGTDSAGNNSGLAVQWGSQTSGSTAAQSWTNSAAAYAAVVTFGTGDPASAAKTNLYQKEYFTGDRNKVYVQVWTMPDYGLNTFDFRMFASSVVTTSGSLPGNMTVKCVYDPVGSLAGQTLLTGVLPTTGFTQQNTPYKVSLPTYKTTTPLSVGNGYILEVSVPEPGSMLAMLSGLVGLVGFGIRRRK